METKADFAAMSSWHDAKARLDAAENDAERARLAGAAAESLNAYLLHPAASIADLAQKLALFRDEALWDGWAEAEPIAAALAADASRLARVH